jgi:hypothetical protein
VHETSEYEKAHHHKPKQVDFAQENAALRRRIDELEEVVARLKIALANNGNASSLSCEDNKQIDEFCNSMLADQDEERDRSMEMPEEYNLLAGTDELGINSP